MAMKRPGPYVGLSANYADDEKIMQAGEDAELLYIRMLAYAARTPLTEGWISDSVLQSRLGILPRTAYDNSGKVTGNVTGTDALSRAEKLLEVGLITRQDSGWHINSWLRWNRSIEEMGKERTQDRSRKTGLTRGSAQQVPEMAPETIPNKAQVPSSNDQDQDQDHYASSARSSKKAPETPFPDAFEVKDSHREKAQKYGLDVEWQRTKFEDHHRSKDSRFRDWSKAFHTWLNNAAEFSTGKSGSAPEPPKKSAWDYTNEDYIRAEEALEQRAAAGDSPF